VNLENSKSNGSGASTEISSLTFKRSTSSNHLHQSNSNNSCNNTSTNQKKVYPISADAIQEGAKKIHQLRNELSAKENNQPSYNTINIRQNSRISKLPVLNNSLGKRVLSTSFLFYPYSNLASLIMNRSSDPSQSSSSSITATTESSNTNSSSSSSYTLFDPNKIHLFVKAGQDGRSQGACPFCQDVFMQLLTKAHTNKFNFDVITINMENPPKEFKELCIKPPVLIHGSSKLLDKISDDMSGKEGNAIILSDVDEIAEYLDRVYPNSTLSVQNPEAKKVCLNVFSKFSFFIREVASKTTSLEAELDKIDAYLRENCDGDKRRFLNGEEMSLLDCSLLPKLQHIRIACESIKRFRIPNKYKHLWRYMQHAYQTDAFQKSCPPDREIIWNWARNIMGHRELLQIVQEAPYKTLTIPEEASI
jgi:chloride intracellular channel protein 2